MTSERLTRLATWCLLILASAALVPVGCSVWINADPDELTLTGGGGAGGIAGGGGIGGAGGIAGSGGTGVAGSGGVGGVYAQADMHWPNESEYDFHPVPFPAEGDHHVTLGVDVVWQNVAAHPMSFDLSVEVAGVSQPLLQIFSVRDRAFVRAGTHLERLRPNATYRVEVTRTSSAAWTQLVDVHSGAVVLTSPVHEIEVWGDGSVTLINARVNPRVTLGEIRAWRGTGTGSQ